MSANNASIYEASDEAPSTSKSRKQTVEDVKRAVNAPLSAVDVGQRASSIVDNMGPIQPPIGQTISGAKEDIKQNVPALDYLIDLGLIGGGALALKKGYDYLNRPPATPPVAPPAAPVATAPSAPVAPSSIAERSITPAATSETPQMKTSQQAFQEAVEAGEIPAKGKIAVSPQDIQMLANSEKAKMEKEIAKAGIKPPQQKTFATEADLKAKMPETVFKPGLGPGDNWLYNTYGAEGRKAILNQFNEGKPVGGYEEAVALSKKAQEVTAGPQIPRDVAKGRGIPPTETNYGKLGQIGKVAGTAGLLLTAAQAANAAQREKGGEKGATNEFLFNLLSAIPGLGTAFNTATFSGGLNTNEEAELARRRQMAPTISRR